MKSGSKHYVEKGPLKSIPIKFNMNTKYMTTILAFKDVAFISIVSIAMEMANERAIILHWN